ncbi:FMN-dependent dehydrogenase [Hypoxylon rubiginosum]|uniref:FMN-dependent dehydrogenase n=1 Tax=Hypoxylon rubiginosum TaxID=110542 RepID=A0ACB9YP83_9PEZI|nr:FMN-dependent dehydrogenase [Hypoxylon rubiginosum]
MANRGVNIDPNIFTIKDLQEAGSKKLPKPVREYYNEGSMDMITLRDNEAAYNRYKIRPRILINVSKIDTSTTIFGTKVSFPLGFAPAAMHKAAHPEGELATSRAAAKAGICMGLSTYSTFSLEDVIAQGKGNPYMFQITLFRNREAVLQILERVEAAGYKALVLTVDAPILGRRLNEYRNSFEPPEGTTFPNISLDHKASFMNSSEQDLINDDTADWESAISWFRQRTKLPLWLKGINAVEDVVLAIRYGLDGIIISNHGGRQFDGVPATLDTLRECAPVAAGHIPIAIDGGIRRGSDIFKAIALGAQHCFVGRVPIWGLAYDGEKGVDLAINLLLNEFKLVMGLAGCRTVSEINRSHLSVLEPNGLLSKL